ncbi:prephenate dehydrogenase [Diaminobutyricimonas aerilata]|uniref:Prephenate dehydrogenase n=1 Tax=Diaminobutyricimonas aerilata TaxID=1162967 RepID=A0A2M9CKP2_9MICO|nr:prephenate dehydrogenase [Diaminobutyricimonas aerilata]PJJ72454.1 prephenate dehydrogenase [Diaminobutyricimonas aerilata]
MTDRRLAEDVRIVGSGLLGTSIGLGLAARGVDVVMDDVSPSARRLAVDYGAGREPAAGDAPGLIVVCVPPDVTASIVARELAAYPDALVTDVASVKAAPLAELRAMGADLGRYLGTHPMAGRERGGAISARADLFVGRPWVLAGHDDISYRRAGAIEDMILDLGAVPIELDVERHDRSVALVSHVPQVVSSLLAARLSEGDGAALQLAGQGLRDVTRVAGSDPALWVQILGANAPAVVDVLRPLRDDLERVIAALDAPEAPGSRRAIADALAAGNTGVARIPGKHGQDRRFSQIVVMVDDTPGELARLLTEIGEAGVNMEDLRLEHSPGAQIGLAEISVVPEAEQRLVAELEERGWTIAGAFA